MRYRPINSTRYIQCYIQELFLAFFHNLNSPTQKLMIISGGKSSSFVQIYLIIESMKNHFVKSESRKKKEKEKKKRWFLENGSKFLKELIADCNGKSNPIQNFSSDQILKATVNFDSSCFVSEDVYYKWYRGRIEDTLYMFKKFSEDRITEHRIEEVYNDIVLSVRMSNHNNFLKLLGCCLEFPFPVLVFEDAEHGVLNQRGGIIVNGEESLLSLSLRLKIGKEIANAVTYLHMAFPKIIIHRDVKPMHVFLDKNWTVKLSDLSFSISLPEGKTRIEAERVLGTFGYLDPLYHETSFVTEYTDVYSFGICLLVLLSGKPAVFTESDEDPRGVLSYVRGLCEVIDTMMVTSDQRLLVKACVDLALRCCEERDENRPKMIDVAKELKKFYLEIGELVEITSRSRQEYDCR